jgi:hypothetical protein
VIKTLYWTGFALAFLSYGLDRAARAVRPEDGGDSLYRGTARIVVAAANAAVWPVELALRLAIWGVARRQSDR